MGVGLKKTKKTTVSRVFCFFSRFFCGFSRVFCGFSDGFLLISRVFWGFLEFSRFF